MTPKVAIAPGRLRAILEGINAFGRNERTGGYNRPAFSPADMAVRRWFAERMTHEGLAVHTDAVGNVFGRGGPSGPSVMVGSHLDTVPEGGAFDGALGCAAALEAVLALRDAGHALQRPVEVVATADEEGRFGGMLGSEALTGRADEDFFANARDAEGVRLCDAMRDAGLDARNAGAARRPPGSVAAFLELHVEQGPILESNGIPVGVATAVSGVTVLSVTLTGVANHSGTTPMEMRADAFVGLARIGEALPRLAPLVGSPQSRLTIGRVALSPNAVHTIPGRAAFTIVLRDVDPAVLGALEEAARVLIGDTAANLALGVEITRMSHLPPRALDAALADRAHQIATALGHPAHLMASGAGHDAQTMAELCPTALLFVPSRGGISHAPEEFTEWSAIEAGATVLANLLATLAAAPD